MSTTTTVLSIDSVKGPYMGPTPFHTFRFVVHVAGTYNTAGRPAFNVLTALQALHQGISSAIVPPAGVVSFGDYDDGTNVYTASNAGIVLSSTHNNVVTFKIESGAVNGSTGTELSTEAVDGYFAFLVTCSTTIGSVVGDE